MYTTDSEWSFASKKTPASNSEVTIFNNNFETVTGKTEKKTQHKDDDVDSTLSTRKGEFHIIKTSVTFPSSGQRAEGNFVSARRKFFIFMDTRRSCEAGEIPPSAKSSVPFDVE